MELVDRFVRFLAGWAWTMVCSAIACAMGLFGGRSLAWVTICRHWARGCLRIIRCEIHIAGREHLVGPAIFVCNHQSFVDVVFLPGLLPRRVKWVAKRSLSFVPLWGWAFRAGAVFIDRRDPSRAIERINEGIDGLPPDWSICIFPEGTRSTDGTVGRFKKGVVRMALQTRLPIVAVGFDGAHTVMPPKSVVPLVGSIELTAGPRIRTEGWSAETLDQHLAEVRDAVERNVLASRARRLAAHTSEEPAHAHSLSRA